MKPVSINVYMEAGPTGPGGDVLEGGGEQNNMLSEMSTMSRKCRATRAGSADRRSQVAGSSEIPGGSFLPKELQSGGDTLSGLILSGREAETRLNEDGEHEFGLAKRGATLEMSNVDISAKEQAIGQISFFPDPPCINARPPPTDSVLYQKKVQDYWKEKATALTCWPLVQEARSKSEFFALDWQSRKADKQPKVFVNIAASPLGVRADRSQEDSSKTGEIVQPGELVIVESTEDAGSTTFLKLGEGRWLFDVKDESVVMAEATQIEVGLWWYRVVCDTCVETRHCPSQDSSLGTGWILQPNEILPVRAHCWVNEHHYAQLADGRGWTFMTRPDAPPHSQEQSSKVVEEVEEEIANGQQNSTLGQVPSTQDAVEIGKWTYSVQGENVMTFGDHAFGRLLHSGDKVIVVKRAYAYGNKPSSAGKSRLWLKLMNSSAWVPETSPEGHVQMALQNILESYQGGGAKFASPKEAWMIGEV